MANFGARLAYPIPDRIVARRRQENALALRQALDRSTPLQRVVARVILTLLGMDSRPLRDDEHDFSIRPSVYRPTSRVA